MSAIIAPVFFVVFVLMAQFVLVNVVVAVLMKHLEVRLFNCEARFFIFLGILTAFNLPSLNIKSLK